MKKLLFLLLVTFNLSVQAQDWIGSTGVSTNYLYRTGRVSIGGNYNGAVFNLVGTQLITHFYYGVNQDVYLRPGKTTGRIIMDHGKVGIGTTSPGRKLTISRASQSTTGQLELRNVGGIMDGNEDGIYFTQNASGTTPLGSFRVKYHNNGMPDLAFYTRSGSTTEAERMTILNNGHIGIGTDTPDEKLEVNGNALIQGDIESMKVRVTASPGNWPDYVFEPTFELRPLSDLEAFVKENKHLPEVPSATEVEDRGQDLGDIQATLLKKVEELTLYVIDQDKKQKSLDERLKALEAENAQLKKALKGVKK